MAGHTTNSAIFLQSFSASIFSTGTFNRNQFTGNLSDRCNTTGPLCTDAAGFNNWGAPGNNTHDGASAPGYFVNPAASDFHIDGTSPPADAATGSTETIDFDGAARGAARDIGADEFGAAAHRLTVRKTGTGSGTVSSNIAGISCGSDCTEVYPDSAVVNLTATPDPSFAFLGFGGDPDCTDGSVVMTSDLECDAPFASVTPGNIVVEKQTDPDGRTETFFFAGDVAGGISDDQQITSTGLVPGAYTVTETDHSLFDLTSITCDDGASATPSTASTVTLTATFQVDPGETVTCIFTNTITTCSAAENDVVLPNETENGARTFEACNSITGGSYTVGATGNVTLEALSVVLQNNFSVLGDLTVLLNVP